MAGGHPDLGGQDHGRVDTDDVLARRHHVAPPLALDVLLELDTQRPVVPGGSLAAVDLTARVDEATALAQADDGVDLVGGHGALFITTTGDEAVASQRCFRANASDYRRPLPPDQIGWGPGRTPLPAVPSHPSHTGMKPRSQDALLTIVSRVVENGCHERTTTSCIRHRGRRGHRPGSRAPLRLLVRVQRGRRQQREARRRGVVLPVAVHSRANRRGPRQREHADRARPGAARPGDQRQADRAAPGVGRGPLSEEPPALRRRRGRPVRDQDQDRRGHPHQPGEARQRGRRPRGRARRPRGRGRRRARTRTSGSTP